jgi:hypothetical protein
MENGGWRAVGGRSLSILFGKALDPLGGNLAGDVAKVSACGVIPEGVEGH